MRIRSKIDNYQIMNRLSIPLKIQNYWKNNFIVHVVYDTNFHDDIIRAAIYSVRGINEDKLIHRERLLYIFNSFKNDGEYCSLIDGLRINEKDYLRMINLTPFL